MRPPRDCRATTRPAATESMLARSITAGSIRCYKDLHHAKITDSPKCRCKECGDADHDKEHLFWTCTQWQASRQPFLSEIEATIAKHSKRSVRIRLLLEEFTRRPCLRQCGLAPWDTSADHLLDAIPRTENFDLENQWWLWSLPENTRKGERWDENRLVVFTDGSSIEPNYTDHQRGGWGVYIAPGHPYNARGPLATRSQTSYRGELRAVAHVVTHATQPVEIVSDCQSVVRRVEQLLRAAARGIKAPPAEAETDIWEVVETIVASAPMASLPSGGCHPTSKAMLPPSHLPKGL